MKSTMSDMRKQVLEERRLKGGFSSLWEIPLINEEQIHKLNFKERLSVRTKLWLRDYYPIFTIILGALSIVYYVVQIIKALK